MTTIAQKHYIKLQGKEYVTYPGLLDAAHSAGLLGIETELVQAPRDDNGNTAIATAKVSLEGRVFTGIGDASPASVNKAIAPHIIRMAETRAKARALRDALNIGECSVEELADDTPGPDTALEDTKRIFGGVDGDTTDTTKPAGPNPKTVVVGFGKYSGKTLGELVAEDRQYVGWLSQNAKAEEMRQAAAAVLK